MRAQRHLAEASGGRDTLLSLLLARGKDPTRVAARFKEGGQWKELSWPQVAEQVQVLAAGLVALGVKPGDRVAIFSATSLSWLLWDLAINAARGICVPIYPSNTPDECRYILNNAECVFAFVDNDVPDGNQAGRLTRLRQRVGDCPSLRKLLVQDGAAGDRELSVADLERMGRGSAAAQSLEAVAGLLRPEDPACFIYTSGTTGDPKGVVLTHGNWAYQAWAIREIEVMLPEDSVLLFLPLAHSFAQVVKAAWLGMGFTLIVAESMDKLLANLAETRPTVLPAVPRVFEKVYNGVLQNGLAAPGLKGKLFAWAFALFDQYVEARTRGREFQSLSFALAQRLVFSKVKAALNEKMGGRLRLFVSGAAPLSPKIAYFFELLGFVVLEGYGLTETAAPAAVNRPNRRKVGTVGPALPGTELKIAPDGEILIRGPLVMSGYHQNPTATAEVVEPDGWFRSGDIGEIDAEGFLRITDRKKDIIVTAGGKNVAPQNLENQLKTFPIVSQAMVYGDKRKYLAVLVCVNEEVARKVVESRGGAAGSYADLARNPEVRKEVQAVVDRINAEQPSYQTLKRFHLMDHDFTQQSGELTPSLKVKRKVCTQRYKAILDGMYDGETVD